jgi:hypothetical protein
MKNALLALALFAFIGTATAHEGKDEKKSKKSAAAKTCSMPEKGTAACCMKKDTKTAAVKVPPAPAAAPVAKSL